MRRFLGNIVVCLFVGLMTASVSQATTVTESGDAGNLPGSAQVISDPAATQITGTIDGIDQDMYALQVGTTQAVNFTASTSSSGDPRLYLFNSHGTLLASNDDCTPLNAEACIKKTLNPGTYYLAISGASVPHGSPVSTWTSQGAEHFSYAINLGGTTGPPPVNHAPTAGSQSLTTTVNVPINFTLAGSDPDGDPISFAVVSGASHGTLSCSGSSCRYTPAPDYTGTDSATYTVTDTGGLSATGSLSFSIGPVVGPPPPPGTTATTLTAPTVNVPSDTRARLAFTSTLSAGTAHPQGRVITFTYGSTVLCTGRTSIFGVASCSAARPAGFVPSNGYTATFAGDATYLASSAMGSFG